jgi:hypothetical protein
MRKGCTLLIVLSLLVIFGHRAAAQSTAAHHAWQVFLQRDSGGGGSQKLVFVDVLTGDTKSLSVSGQRYSLVGDAVMFFDPASRRVMLAAPGGQPEPHPFIQPDTDTRRIDWLVSPDQSLIAWTLTNGSSASALKTFTTVANLDGTNPRQVLVDGPRSGIRAMPVAYSADKSVLYMDYQPDGVSDLTAFSQYAGLFALDLATSEVTNLPGEPGCFCGAGIGAGWFLRLALSPDLSGFDLKVYSLAGSVEHTVPALRLRNYTQAGDILISPDGQHAVYALAQIKNFGTSNQSVETVFMLVDLTRMTQDTLTQPITTFVRPLAWTEDDTAVLFTSPQRNGTWKVSLSDGKLNKVAEATYLGIISS